MLLEMLFITLITVYGGWLSRMCGGAPIKLPLGLDQWLYALPYAGIAFLAANTMTGTVFEPYPYFVWGAAALALATAFLGKRTGHGQYLDLGTWTKIIKPEKLDFLVKLFFGKDPNVTAEGPGNYWRDVTGMVITGAFVPLGAIIVLFMTHPVLALGLLLGGAAKGVAYMIGWAVYPKGQSPLDLEWDNEVDEATEVGELLTGLFGYFPLAMAYAILLGIL